MRTWNSRAYRKGNGPTVYRRPRGPNRVWTLVFVAILFLTVGMANA